jgi:hypothetical protein
MPGDQAGIRAAKSPLASAGPRVTGIFQEQSRSCREVPVTTVNITRSQSINSAVIHIPHILPGTPVPASADCSF